jgi:hypothetical protein
MRKVYNRIRKALGTTAVQDTQSCYLFPWGYKERLEEAIRKADPGGKVRWRVRKFDDSEAPQLRRDVHVSFKQMMRRIRGTLRKRLEKAESLLNKGELDRGGWTLAEKYARGAARRELKKARRLAALFEMTDLLEAGLQSLERLADMKLEQMYGGEEGAPATKRPSVTETVPLAGWLPLWEEQEDK